MSTQNYFPDSWVVIKVKQGKLDSGIYKVLAGWSGGYLSDDCWRLNSGIRKVTTNGDYFEFWGWSGSCYVCHKDSYRLTMANVAMYNKLIELQQFDGQVELMDEATDWMAIV